MLPRATQQSWKAFVVERSVLPARLELVVRSDADHSLMFISSATVVRSMREFAILTNRKRAIIALAHSVVVLLVATWQMVAAPPAVGLWIPATVSRGTWILCAVLIVVSAILLWLLAISRGWMEKIYFGLCTASASSGLLRTAAGDQTFHAGLYVRVVMLGSAVLVGLIILRLHLELAESKSEA